MKILCVLSTRCRSTLLEYLPHNNDPSFWVLALIRPHRSGCQAAMLMLPRVDAIPKLDKILPAENLPLRLRAKNHFPYDVCRKSL